MYKIGSAILPEKDETIWALDIDYYPPSDEYPLIQHGAQIRVHGDSLSACLLKANVICEALNSEGIALVEVLTQLLEHARVMEDQLLDTHDKTKECPF